MAKDEYGLTLKQRAFADEYITNGGNGTKAYFVAYPSTKKEVTARTNASKLLTNTNILKYIEEQTKMTFAERGMVSRNAINHLIELAMGIETTSRSTVYNNITEELEQDLVYTNAAPPKVQVEAMALLMKFLGTDNVNNDLLRKRLEIDTRKAEAEAKISQNKADKLTSDEHTDELLKALINPPVKEDSHDDTV
ncbi:terminase small subunit [Aerococcus viridans]